MLNSKKRKNSLSEDKVYTHNSVGHFFELIVKEFENSVQPSIIVEFYADRKLLPFDYGKAFKEILAIYLPEKNENNN